MGNRCGSGWKVVNKCWYTHRNAYIYAQSETVLFERVQQKPLLKWKKRSKENTHAKIKNGENVNTHARTNAGTHTCMYTRMHACLARHTHTSSVLFTVIFLMTALLFDLCNGVSLFLFFCAPMHQIVYPWLKTVVSSSFQSPSFDPLL